MLPKWRIKFNIYNIIVLLRPSVYMTVYMYTLLLFHWTLFLLQTTWGWCRTFMHILHQWTISINLVLYFIYKISRTATFNFKFIFHAKQKTDILNDLAQSANHIFADVFWSVRQKVVTTVRRLCYRGRRGSKLKHHVKSVVGLVKENKTAAYFVYCCTTHLAKLERILKNE